jgi:hypothetical protein
VANAGISDKTGVYRGRITATGFTPTEGVEWGKKYFWRVDEVGPSGAITTGLVWDFTVADYLLVDDFESYTDDDGGRFDRRPRGQYFQFELRGQGRCDHSAVARPEFPVRGRVPDARQRRVLLNSLTGVNPAGVKKLSFGVGDRKKPVAGGTGRIYLDDLRITRGAPAQPNAAP